MRDARPRQHTSRRALSCTARIPSERAHVGRRADTVHAPALVPEQDLRASLPASLGFSASHGRPAPRTAATIAEAMSTGALACWGRALSCSPTPGLPRHRRHLRPPRGGSGRAREGGSRCARGRSPGAAVHRTLARDAASRDPRRRLRRHGRFRRLLRRARGRGARRPAVPRGPREQGGRRPGRVRRRVHARGAGGGLRPAGCRRAAPPAVRHASGALSRHRSPGGGFHPGSSGDARGPIGLRVREAHLP